MNHLLTGIIIIFLTTVTQAQVPVTIISHPAEADVVLDGQNLGTTPVKNHPLVPGKHRLRLTRDKYRTVYYPFELQNAKGVTLTFRLHRLFPVKFRTREKNLRFEWNGEHAWKDRKIRFTMEEGIHTLSIFEQDSLLDSVLVRISEPLDIRYSRSDTLAF